MKYRSQTLGIDLYKNAKVITLSSSAQVFSVGQDGIWTPASITISAYAQNCNIGYYKIDTTEKILDSSVDNLTFTILPPTSTQEATGTTIKLGAGATSITVQVKENSSSEVYDEITIGKVVDGSDTYTMMLSNQAHGVACDENGVPKTGELWEKNDLVGRAKCEVSVWKGSTKLTYNTDYTLSFGDCINFIQQNNNIFYVRKISKENEKVSWNGEDITITVTGINKYKDKLSLSQIMSLTKSNDGAKGAEGVSPIYCSIDSSAGTNFNLDDADNISTILTAELYQGGDILEKSSEYYYEWFYYNSTGTEVPLSNLADGTNITITVVEGNNKKIQINKVSALLNPDKQVFFKASKDPFAAISDDSAILNIARVNVARVGSDGGI